MKCPLCNQEIEEGQARRLVPVDRPVYMNLFFHMDCFKKIENINQFIGENFDLCYNYYLEKGEKKRKR